MILFAPDQEGIMEEMPGVSLGFRPGRAYGEGVLVFIPKGGEDEMLCAVITEYGINTMNCSGPEEFCRHVEIGAGVAVVAGELLAQLWSSGLKQTLGHQLAWSDFPLIVLAGGGAGSETGWQILRAMEPSANVMVLERPVSAITLLSTVRAALRSRHQQYEFRDLAGRKLAEENLLKEMKFSDAAINSLPGIFYVVDAHGNQVRWNKAFEEITGYSAEEIAGMHPLDFFPEEFKPIIAKKMQVVFTEGQVTAEADLLTKHGARIPYFLTGKRRLIEERPYLIGMGMDMSEKKRRNAS